MRKFRTSLRTVFVLALVAALGAIALVSSASGKSERSSTAQAVPGEILVGFKAPVSATAQKDVLAGVGSDTGTPLRWNPGALVSVDSQSTAGAIRKLERDGRVAYAEPNFVVRADVPNDPFMSRLWGLDNLGQTVNWTAGAPDADIDAREAWSVSTGSPNVVVAVIDTGVDLDSPRPRREHLGQPGRGLPGLPHERPRRRRQRLRRRLARLGLRERRQQSDGRQRPRHPRRGDDRRRRQQRARGRPA